MSTLHATSKLVGIGEGPSHNPSLAPSITWAASKQTYYTVHFLVDKGRALDAYRAYAYFRWVDDRLDREGLDAAGRVAFATRQRALVEHCYRGKRPSRLSDEERLLADLIRGDREPDSGLQSYIRHMMAVMTFDAGRRGRLISSAELNTYTHRLAVAVTEALHHFIGHDGRAPRNEMRYRAAEGAHITHMLRDTLEDVEAGYFNIPREVVESGRISPSDTGSAPYRAWVAGRVQTARECFRAGRAYLAQVESLRCRLAGHAYIARFESVLDAIERDGYRLRAAYPERRSLKAGITTGRSVLAHTLNRRPPRPVLRRASVPQG